MCTELELPHPLSFSMSSMSPIVQRPVMSPADFAWDTDELPVPAEEDEGNDE